MAAYTAVISLLQTLEQQNPDLFHDHTAQTLDSLHATAEYFQHVLENISKSSRFDPEKIKSLEEKMRVAASDAEDVIELKISQIIKELSWTFGILQHQDLLPVVEKMDTTKKQVMEIVSRYAVDQVLELSGDSLIDTPKSYPMLEDDIVHGLDDDLEIIIRRLTGPPRDLDVVTISGMGGIGKTTLARKVYDHLTIRYHFDILVWVTISQEFRVRNVLLEALRCISKQRVGVKKDYDNMIDSELADLVQKKLKGRRYLLVVDDIWSRDVWDSIRGIFPNYNNGSRILLTTRENEVAMYANTRRPHQMRLLSLENGWRLLCDKLFGPKHDYPPEFEKIGKEIVGKCQGLPLAISVIAGHLSKMPRKLEGWKDVARNLSEIIASHPDKCFGVLGLSYHHLPNRLKPCFLSMGDFPDDFQVDTRRLIRLWIAEGFIRTSENGKSLEEVAIVYLEDLISRNLIQARKRRFHGEIKACGIHDLLREFCLREARMTEHMFVASFLNSSSTTLLTQQHDFRRFSFQNSPYSVDDFCKLLPHVARSIYFFSLLNLPLSTHSKLLRILPIPRFSMVSTQNPEFLSRFNLLRVLVIFHIYPHVEFPSFPVVITKLFHLRYLQYPFHVNIPDSISELQNLQTLICSGYPNFDITLTRNIWMMKNLRYIRVGRATYLPNPRTESLVNLEELSGICFTSCTNEVFSSIPNLKRLIIHLPFFSLKHLPDSLMDMSSLRKLEEFKFYCWLDSSRMNISIKSFVFPTSLKRLSLSRCNHFLWEDMSSTVIILPNLEELRLNDCRADDDVWRLSDEDNFTSLKLLVLSSLNLEHWEVSSDNFPNLKRLVLKNCDELQEIPIDFGEIATLESIELHDCSAAAEDCAREIEQEQEDMGNNYLKVYIHSSCRN